MIILACAGVNGREDALQKLLAQADKRHPDAVLFAGGILDPASNDGQRDAFMRVFFEHIYKASEFVAVIPGPRDTPLTRFLKAGMNAEVVHKDLFIAHATPVSLADVAVSGLGGIITEDEDSMFPEIKYSRTTAEYFLRTLWHIDKPFRIMMLSEAPPELAGGKGSRLIHEFVKSYHPYFTIVMGNKQYRGSQKIDPHSFIVNPGLLIEGSAARIDTISRDIDMLDF